MRESVSVRLHAAGEHLGDGEGWRRQEKHPREGVQLWLVGREATRGAEERTGSASL